MPQYQFFFSMARAPIQDVYQKTWQLYIVNRVAGGNTNKVCLF